MNVQWKLCHTHYICMISLWYEFSDELQARNPTKGFVTHITFVRFLSSMNSPNTSKVSILSKALATNISFIWFLSSINSPMNYNICTLTKGLPHISHLYGFSPVDRQIAWWTMEWGLWHRTGDRDQDHPQEKDAKRQNGCLRGPYK